MIINSANLSIISQAVLTRFNQGLQRPVTPWQFLAMEIPSVTGSNVYPYLKEFGVIREWLGDREMQNIEAGKFEIANKSFEQTHKVPRVAIEDDTIGLYAPMFEQTGQNVASFPAEQVFGLLKSGFTSLGPDGQYFFDTDHSVAGASVSNFGGGSADPWVIVDASKVFKPVIWQPRKAFDLVRLFNPDDPNVFFQNAFIWGVDGRSGVGFSPFWQLAFGSKQTLDDAAVTAALTALAVQRGETGKPLGIQGTHLVCSPTIGETARRLINAERLANGADNPLYRRLQVVVAPEML